MHRPRTHPPPEPSALSVGGEASPPPASQPSADYGVVKGETDEALVRSSVGGDHRAYGELVVRYQRMVYTLALRMVGSAEDARELTQSVFVKAWRGLSGFDP